jgi:hypothetical protein
MTLQSLRTVVLLQIQTWGKIRGLLIWGGIDSFIHEEFPEREKEQLDLGR